MNHTFASLGVPPALADVLAGDGITDPFPVQVATIPDVLAGRDVCGRAPTGSGKTLAFGVPMVASVSKAHPQAPTGLVLSPTRELADQIRRAIVPVAKAANRFVTSAYGGVGYELQTRELRKGTDILVACPGRLLDLIDRGDCTLTAVEMVVVDEADQLADMGFLPDVRAILDQTPPDRQTLLFSATLDGEIGELTRRYQRDPVRHEVGDAEPDVHAMRHVFWKIRHEDGIDHTKAAIEAAGPTIVFVRTRHGADRVARRLEQAGVSAVAIHGNRSQGQRNRALDDFTRGRVRALVATDVAARGIHVDEVAAVVHYDPPADAKTYLHRSGRTARAGATGVVVSLVRPPNRRPVGALQKELGLSIAFVEPDPSVLGGWTPSRRAKPAGKPEKPGKSKGGSGAGGRSGGKPGKPKGGKPKQGKPKSGSGSGGKPGGKPPSRSGPKPGRRRGGSVKKQAPRAPKVHRKGGGAKGRAKRNEPGT